MSFLRTLLALLLLPLALPAFVVLAILDDLLPEPEAEAAGVPGEGEGDEEWAFVEERIREMAGAQ